MKAAAAVAPLCLPACLPAWGSSRAAGRLSRACTRAAGICSMRSIGIHYPSNHPALTAHLPAPPRIRAPNAQLAEFVSCPVLLLP